MDFTQILDWGGNFIYAMLALVALYGAFTVILLLRRIQEKQFSNAAAEEFLEQVREKLQAKDFDGVAELCDSPAYWSKAVPQLVLFALNKKEQTMSRLRRGLAETFEREILADLEYRMSWVGTIVKSAPMLGLLGTVIGMISAFQQLDLAQSAGGEGGEQLAGAISVALFTTAAGLAVAIPLVLAGALINVRIGRLQDGVQHWIGEFLDDYEVAVGSAGGRDS
jgi:biopolymer transport protein ExbB